MVVRLFAAFLIAALSSCGKGDFANSFDQPEGKPVIASGANWQANAPDPGPSSCPSPRPSPGPSASPDSQPSPQSSPSPGASPSPQPRSASGWCKLVSWWPGCKKAGLATVSFVQGSCSPNGIHVLDPPHATDYCQVDASGNPTSADQVFARQEGDPVHSGGGGCIQRPIRDVWGTFFNDALMKPDDVDEYSSTPEPSLIDPAQRVVFAFDLYNKKNVVLINPDWTVRWFHAIPYGTWERPNEVAINFQKISGTGYIRLLKGGYVLDRVTDSVTSFVMDQNVDATQYDPDKAHHDVERALERARTGQSTLPAQPQSPLPSN